MGRHSPALQHTVYLLQPAYRRHRPRPAPAEVRDVRRTGYLRLRRGLYGGAHDAAHYRHRARLHRGGGCAVRDQDGPGTANHKHTPRCR